MKENAYNVGEDIPITFQTVGTDGAPITLAGTPTACVRVKRSATNITTGVGSITVDRGSTGNHDLLIDSDLMTEGDECEVILTAGTVDSISVVGMKIGGFYLRTNDERRAKAASDFYWQALQQNMGEISDDITGALDSTYASSDDDFYNGHMLLLSDGKARTIIDYNGTTLVPTLDRSGMINGFDVDQPYMTIPNAIPLSLAINVLSDVEAVNGNTAAADRLEEFWKNVERLVVDTTGYAGSTTDFQISNTTDEPYAYLNQVLYCATTGETFGVTGYSHAGGGAKVRLTVNTMPATLANGTVLLKMGRRT